MINRYSVLLYGNQPEAGKLFMYYKIYIIFFFSLALSSVSNSHSHFQGIEPRVSAMVNRLADLSPAVQERLLMATWVRIQHTLRVPCTRHLVTLAMDALRASRNRWVYTVYRTGECIELYIHRFYSRALVIGRRLRIFLRHDFFREANTNELGSVFTLSTKTKIFSEKFQLRKKKKFVQWTWSPMLCLAVRKKEVDVDCWYS